MVALAVSEPAAIASDSATARGGQASDLYTPWPGVVGCAWHGFEDDVAGIARVRLCVGDALLACNLAELDVPIAAGHGTVALSGWASSPGTTLRCSVWLYNTAGMRTGASSAPMIQADGLPAMGTVSDGAQAGVDMDVIACDSGITAHWQAAAHPSGIVQYAWSIWDMTNGSTAVLPWRALCYARARLSWHGLGVGAEQRWFPLQPRGC